MRERKRWRRWIFGLVVGAMMVGAYELSPRLLYEDSPRERAEVIIILGGDAEGRVWRGLELYKGGVGRGQVRLSATGEDRINRMDMKGSGPFKRKWGRQD